MGLISSTNVLNVKQLLNKLRTKIFPIFLLFSNLKVWVYFQMSGDRWETGHDFFQDLDYLSEFHNDSNDSLVLEINQNGVLQIDEDSDESHEHGPEHVVQETLSVSV